MDNGNAEYNFQSLPGIRLDGTQSSSKAFIDGENVRFYQGTPLKLGGWKKLLIGQTEIIRGMYGVAIGNFTRVFLFRNSGLSSIDIQADGSVSAEVDLTPENWVPPIPGTPDLVFSSDAITIASIFGETLSSESVLFVVGIPNSEVVEQTVEAPVYYINVNIGTQFLPLGQSVSGGLIVRAPYLILFGNNGIMRYSYYDSTTETSNPLIFPVLNFLIVTGRKLLAARAYRNSIIFFTKPRPYEVIIDFSTSPVSFTVLTTALVGSLLSPQCIVDGDRNSFFWIGNSAFYSYNGAVSKIENNYNKKYFFDNLNKQYKGKVWGIYNETYNEVWWFAPQLGDTECTMAYFACLDEQIGQGEIAWANTIMPRASGISNTILDQPIYASSSPITNTVSGFYALWLHEEGVDVEEQGQKFPLKSSFQSHMLRSTDINPSINTTLKMMMIEKNFVQIGDLSIELFSYAYADSTPVSNAPFLFSPNITHINPTFSGRYVSIKYTSNQIGGNYHMGDNNVEYQFSSIKPAGKY